MSIVFVGVYSDGIVLAGDGVSYDAETGCVAQYVSKLHLFPDLGCALGFTGMGSSGRAYALMIEGRYQNFDALVSGAVDDLRQLHFAMTLDGRRFRCDHDMKLSAALAGWSDERQRFEAYRITSYEKECLFAGQEAPALPAWTLVPIDYVWASMVPNPEHHERFGLLKRHPDLIELGVRMVCAARASSGPMEHADNRAFGVGGFVQLAILDAQGTQSWVAHRWPEDEVGKPIDPTRGLPLPRWILDKDAAAGTVGAVGSPPSDTGPDGESFSGAVAA